MVKISIKYIRHPGHVIFLRSLRSLSACEGSVLVVSLGEAQTLANAYQAIDVNHEILPIKTNRHQHLNQREKEDIEQTIGIDTKHNFCKQDRC